MIGIMTNVMIKITKRPYTSFQAKKKNATKRQMSGPKRHEIFHISNVQKFD